MRLPTMFSSSSVVLRSCRGGAAGSPALFEAPEARARRVASYFVECRPTRGPGPAARAVSIKPSAAAQAASVAVRIRVAVRCGGVVVRGRPALSSASSSAFRRGGYPRVTQGAAARDPGRRPRLLVWRPRSVVLRPSVIVFQTLFQLCDRPRWFEL